MFQVESLLFLVKELAIHTTIDSPHLFSLTTLKSKIERKESNSLDSFFSVSYTHLTLPTTPYV